MEAATPALAHSPLEPQLQKAGATMVARHGWWVAAHYGSPAGELALCETAVGLADRSDLGKLELRGERSALEQLVGQLSGGSVDPGDALLAEGAWWCAVSRTHVIALCDAAETERLAASARDAVRWTPGATAEEDALTCHRMVGRVPAMRGNAPKFLTKGDALSQIESFENHRQSEILGKVAAISRDGKTWPVPGRIGNLARLFGSLVAMPILKLAGR